MNSVNSARENTRQLFDDWAFAYPNDHSSELWLEFIGQHFLDHLPPGSRILDVGCGRGELVDALIAKGYRVSGLDLSEEMLRYARENVPKGEFILGDICSLELQPSFHAVVASSAVFNYILSLDELKKAFRNLYSSLLDKGWFAFDLSEGEIRQDDEEPIEEILGDFAEDYAWLKRSIYNPNCQSWETQHVTFRSRAGVWQRQEVSCSIKGYSRTEVQSALEEIGFEKVRLHDVTEDVPLSELRDSRIVYIFRKP